MRIVADIPDEIMECIHLTGGICKDSQLQWLCNCLDEGVSFDTIIDNIKKDIRECTECPFGMCIGSSCPSNTDCMLMGEHAIEIIDKHVGNKEA